MATTSQNQASLVTDIERLATELDAVTARDDLDRVKQMLRRGREEHARFIHRWALLLVAAEDTTRIEFLLETVRARLRLLDGLKARKTGAHMLH